MQCPHCKVEVNESWGYNATVTDTLGHDMIEGIKVPRRTETQFLYMACPSEECGRLIVKGVTTRTTYQMQMPFRTTLDEWFVLPRQATRYIDPLVPEQYANDYRQAAAILGDSAKASAALSRRILADLLADYGEYKQYGLADRINGFKKDPQNPSRLSDNLDYLREIGDFAAHTQKDDVAGIIVDVEPGEAEWCLELVDRLFDYYIIGPKRDESMRSDLDAKLAQAGRKPIRPSPTSDNEQEEISPENSQGPRNTHPDTGRVRGELRQGGAAGKRITDSPPEEELSRTSPFHHPGGCTATHTRSGNPEDA